MREAVTTDASVIEALGRKAMTSAGLAAKMKLHVFQVTARLKSMERRGLAARNQKGEWLKGGEADEFMKQPLEVRNPPAEKRKASPPPNGGKPDDSRVPVIHDMREWKLEYEWCHHLKSGEERIDVYFDANGTKWTRAHWEEKAELVFQTAKYRGISPLRLVHYEGSVNERRIGRDRRVNHGLVEREIAKDNAEEEKTERMTTRKPRKGIRVRA